MFDTLIHHYYLGARLVALGGEAFKQLDLKGPKGAKHVWVISYNEPTEK